MIVCFKLNSITNNSLTIIIFIGYFPLQSKSISKFTKAVDFSK